MKKYVIFLSLFTFAFSAQNYPYFVNDKHGFLPNNKLDLYFQSLQMNDTVDLLNLKEDELNGSSLNDSAIGDMNGYEAGLRYKIDDKSLFSIKYQNANVDYGFGSLDNQKIDMFYRRNFVSNLFALDFGFTQNKAKDMKITDIEIINSKFISKFNAKIVEENGILAVNEYKVINTEDINEEVAIYGDPFLSINDMEDNSFYIRALRSFISDGFFSTDFFVAYYYTKIDSRLDSSFFDEPGMEDIIDVKTNLARDEHKLNIGLNHSWFINKWFMDITYEFDFIKRDDFLSENNTNFKLSGSLGYKIYNNMIFYMGAKVMTNQFAGEIPYLYNKYTQSSFDKKYGWAKAGLLLKF